MIVIQIATGLEAEASIILSSIGVSAKPEMLACLFTLHMTAPHLDRCDGNTIMVITVTSDMLMCPTVTLLARQ